jgi:hypothetical protein
MLNQYGNGLFDIGMADVNKMKKKIYIKCKKCKDKIFGDTKKKLIYCKCKSIGIDGCEDYIRIIGNKEDYKILK